MITQPYVPVMRVLRAEMRALSRIDQEQRRYLSPLFRIVRTRNAESREKFLGRAVDDIARAWALSGRAFVELAELPENDGSLSEVDTLVLLHKSLRERGVGAQPVVPTHAQPDVRSIALALSRAAGTALGVRVFANDLEDPFHLVRSIRTFCGEKTRLGELDVLIDLERVPPHSMSVRDQVLGLLGQLDNGQDAPNSITVIGSSVPEDYEGIPRNSIREVIKFERDLCRYISRMVRTGHPRDMLEICASHHPARMATQTRRELAFG